jgi:hypothetical protein
MKAIRLMLKDRRRSQRGSVLSAVLIIVAFLGILSGALMTELSGGLISSRALVSRVTREATVNSAVELAINQLQSASLGSPCPGPTTVNLNGLTATASYIRCAPVVDSRSLPLVPIAQSSPFTVDGTHVQLAANQQQHRDAYLVSDLDGNLYEFNYGSSQGWSVNLQARVTGPPMSAYDESNSQYDVVDMVPVTNPNDHGVSPGCGQNGFCVALLTEETGTPSKVCFMAAHAVVRARPASASAFANVAYFGDGSGTVFAYSTLGGGGGGEGNGGGDCSPLDSITNPSGQPVVAGPVVVSGGGQRDYVYVIASDGSSSTLWRYTFANGQFSGASSLGLPAANAIGLALDNTSPQNPPRMAITFGDGHVAMVRIANNFQASVTASRMVAANIQAAPYWCHCQGIDLIGVGGTNGALFLLDGGLTPVATYPAGGAAISSAPVSDAAGNWFFGADDSRLHEVQYASGQGTMTQATQWTLAGRVGSSPIIGGCGSIICIYLGARNGSAYLIQLDARDAIVTACVSTAPPSCSGANPRLWAQVEVGSMGNTRTVHVSGWSYYSP